MLINRDEKPEFIEKECQYHGYTDFKLTKNRKSYYYACYPCLKMNWKKAAARKRLKPGKMEYQLEYSRQFNRIRTKLSVYLSMILIAANIKPE